MVIRPYIHVYSSVIFKDKRCHRSNSPVTGPEVNSHSQRLDNSSKHQCQESPGVKGGESEDTQRKEKGKMKKTVEDCHVSVFVDMRRNAG